MSTVATFSQLRHITGMTTADINARTAELVSGNATATQPHDELLLHAFNTGITTVGVTGLPAPAAGWYARRRRRVVDTPSCISRGAQRRIAELVATRSRTTPHFDSVDVAILTEAAHATNTA